MTEMKSNMLTADQLAAVRRRLLKQGHIPTGLGTDDEACTIAAINLALTGELTDDDPSECMCPVIRRWTITVQDRMPADIRDSREWREAAVQIAGSRSTSEVERLRVEEIIAWMWDALADEAVLAAIPAGARKAWDEMLTKRTPGAAANAAYVNNAAYADAAWAAWAANAAYVNNAAYADAAWANNAAYYAAYAAYYASYADADAYWGCRDPVGLLRKLTTIGGEISCYVRRGQPLVSWEAAQQR
jgi:hypothetical protein